MKIAQREYIALLCIVAIGAWLRLSHLDLIEFKGDEAVAANLALQFVKGGELPTAGLMSSVGVTNPPLFIYLLIPMFFLTTSVVAVSCMIAVLGLAAVLATWWIGRKYYGPWCGLVAAVMFATAPWAVIYSRKIWAQDFVPVFATGLMWALHSLIAGRNARAIFWVVLLPLCVIQIHFSGLAMAVMVVAILALLRPKMDWRWAVGGLVAALILLVPYLRMQAKNDWRDFQQARAQVGGQKWDIPKGMTIRPDSGYPLPRRPSEAWIHALAFINSGEIEDVMGLDKPAFDARTGLSNGLQLLQRILVVGGLVWLCVVVAREKLGAQREIMLLGWLVVPVVVFTLAQLWTYLSYYAILYPAFFLATGAAVEKCPVAKQKLVGIVVVALCLGGVLYMTDFYRFVGGRGGAHGTYGTGVGHKLQAARHLAGRLDAKTLMLEQRLRQLDQIGPDGRARVELAQIDLPWLATVMPGDKLTAAMPTNTFVLVYDANRANYDPQQVTLLATAPHETFGPMRLYFLQQ